MPKKLTQAEFLAKAVAVHGVSRYDYSQAIYTGTGNTVKIICPEHGMFEQVPFVHLSCGCGCPKCGGRTRLSTSEFIAQSQAKHGVGVYDYSQAAYINSREKIKIICPKHGIFEQKPSSHMRGQGCPKCGKKRMADARWLGAERFIKKAQKVHGVGTYDYSQVTYLDSLTKVRIVCPAHGVFEQAPINHTTGRGGKGQKCPRCAMQATIGSLLSNTAEFIECAQKVHGVGTYDYSQVDYRRTHLKVEIICPEHGMFEQKPHLHKLGAGCPVCGMEKSVASSAARGRIAWAVRAAGRTATLYFLRIFSPQESFYKVGVTYLTVEQRYRAKGTLAGYDYEILATHCSVNATAVYDWEQSILETFSHLRYRPKMYFDGATECFLSADEILSIFPL